MENPLTKLPPEQQAATIDAVSRTSNQVYIDPGDVKTMFDAWRVMFPYDNQKESCRACVVHVVSKMRYYVGQITERKEVG